MSAHTYVGLCIYTLHSSVVLHWLPGLHVYVRVFSRHTLRVLQKLNENRTHLFRRWALLPSCRPDRWDSIFPRSDGKSFRPQDAPQLPGRRWIWTRVYCLLVWNPWRNFFCCNLLLPGSLRLLTPEKLYLRAALTVLAARITDDMLIMLPAFFESNLRIIFSTRVFKIRR